MQNQATQEKQDWSLPFKPFDACRKEPGKVNSELLVRFDDNDYSAPMEYAYHDVTVKGYTDRVEICRFNDVIAVHRRCWDREKQIFDPLHYLPLLERKPHSLPFARPFENFTLPKCFEVHIMEANGPSYRLRESKRRLKQNRPDTDDPPDHEGDDRQVDPN